ncbi:glycine--tRNA ligase subunit beta [Hippea maritima]|uniref:Glycine--tRNA ligase beta subunit n=1 Tax=Hippea maritima (strain ATCC 700847 / DSM 10411 / MH2) TaxID=760142 RepID=F2LVW0_HIPMA|nr:glycine--tRNA ligase subunit beta [Hippea maritima]AEA33894.1 Glycyl-tRNA synthetase beta subunit [Hippea maritima DSM 10411]
MKLLFELFTEELPTSEMEHLEKDFLEASKKILSDKNIEFNNLIFYLTPRRMALKFEFDEFVKVEDKKVLGPPKSVCFKDGKPTKALEGFLKKNNATMDDIVEEKTKKGEYIAVIIKGKNVQAKPIVIQAIDQILKDIHFNKQMRWGDGEFEFTRPVHGVVFLIDNEIVDFEFKGKKASNTTYGHRFLSSGSFRVEYDNYESTLKENFVIVNQNERRQLILNQLKEYANKKGAKLVYDEELLNEVVNLVEYPVMVIGRFEEKFLKLPKEVLITSMKDHQRYFAFTKDGKLLNEFAAISNIKTDNMDLIREGYERVLRARFSDAEFFFEEDKKHKLEEFVPKLSQMMFHEKLGSQLDRTNRLVGLAEFLAEKLGFDTNKAKRAAYLSKADLLTQMVYEFPELQGVMGREYALLSSEDSEVATAIYEQYLPKEDEIPRGGAGICLSIADKLDIIVGGFFAGLKPTGAKDPYGLRRAALGIIRTLIENGLFLNLREVLEKSAQLYNKTIELYEIEEFFAVRFKNYFSDYPHDVLEAITFKFDDIYDAYLRLKALNEFVESDKNKEKQFAIKRVFNILKEFEGSRVDESLFNQDEERALFDKVKQLEEVEAEFISKKDYLGLLNQITSNKDVIDNFFDSVMVMDKDEKVRNNRLSLLNKLRKIVLNIANFKFLEI